MQNGAYDTPGCVTGYVQPEEPVAFRDVRPEHLRSSDSRRDRTEAQKVQKRVRDRQRQHAVRMKEKLRMKRLENEVVYLRRQLELFAPSLDVVLLSYPLDAKSCESLDGMRQLRSFEQKF